MNAHVVYVDLFVELLRTVDNPQRVPATRYITDSQPIIVTNLAFENLVDIDICAHDIRLNDYRLKSS